MIDATHEGPNSIDESSLNAQTVDGLPRILAIGLESIAVRAGGLNRYFIQLITALRELGVPIIGVVTGAADGTEELESAVASPSAPLIHRLRAIWLAMAEHGDADLVDAHFALTALPLLLSRLRRRPFVVHFQGPWAEESAAVGERPMICRVKRWVEKLIYKRADAIIVLSRSFRRVLVERYGIRPWVVHVMSPGVDLETFEPGSKSKARAAIGLPNEPFVLVAIRRLVPRMGLDCLLDAFSELIRDIDAPVKLCIVGSGPQREQLESRSATLGLGDLVSFVGHVNDEDLVHYYQAADASVVPSLALEGFGLVVLESLAAGTPVVASDVGGLSEALEGLAPDLLVPAGDARALARRLKDAITGLRPLPTAEECRNYARNFSWAGVADLHLELYRRLIHSANGRVAELDPAKWRVVIIDHSAQLSGGELAIYRTIPSLTAVDVHVILAQEGPLVPLLDSTRASVEVLAMDEGARDLRKDRVRPSAIPIKVIAKSGIYVLRLAWRLARLRPDLVHTNSLKAAIYGGLAARIVGIPCIWHVRDRISDDYLPSSAVRIVQVAATMLPSAIIVNSRATLATLPVTATARAQVIYDSLAPGARDPSPARAKITAVIPSPVLVQEIVDRGSRPDEVLRVAMVGRLAPWKGQDVFLRAFAEAFQSGSEQAVLVGAALFGEDDYERGLVDLVEDLGLKDRVEFRGFQPAIYEELARADVLVHASIIPEPFGQVVIEGMAAGLPIVAAGAGGPAEILVDGDTGLLYPPGDVEKLAGLLRRLADDPQLRRSLGDKARAASTNYAPDRIAAQIIDVYERTLRKRARISAHRMRLYFPPSRGDFHR